MFLEDIEVIDKNVMFSYEIQHHELFMKYAKEYKTANYSFHFSDQRFVSMDLEMGDK